jgi:PAS domain S-box-containing protein/excisionase family DNA binding protein
MAGEYLSTGQAARLLGVSRGTIRNAVDAGELRAIYRMPGGGYRFMAPDVQRYAQWRTVRHQVETQARAAARARARQVLAGTTGSMETLMERLATIPREGESDPGTEIDDLLTLLADSLQVGLTLVCRCDGEQWRVTHAHDRAGLGFDAGALLPWAEVFSRALAAKPTASLVVEDVRTDARMTVPDVTPAWRVGTVTAVPLYTAGAELYGALCTLHPSVRTVPGGELAMLRLAGRMVMQAIGNAQLYAAEQARALVAEELVRVREASEAALRASEARYRQIVETSLEGIFQLDAADRFVFANQQVADLTGYTLTELQGMPAAALDVPEEHEANEARRAAGHRGDVGTLRFERRLRRKDGAARWVEITVVVLVDEDGRYAGVFGMYTDIHERQLAEQALRQSERDFRLLAENSTDVIVRLSPDLIVLYASPSVRQLLGRAPDEVVGWRALDFVHPGDRTAIEQAVTRILAQREAITVTYHHLRTDGTGVWIEITGRAIWDEVTGEPREIQAAMRDVTARRQAEQALLRSTEERLEQAAVAEALAETTSLLARSFAFESIPAEIMQLMAHVVPCTTTQVFTYREGWVEVAGAYGEPRMPLGTVIGRLEGEGGHFPRTADQSRLWNETRQVPGWQNIAPWVDEQEVRSAMLLPVAVHGEVFGCLGVGSTRPQQFTEQHLRVAEAFAVRIAQALWNARLYQLERARARAAEHLATLRNEFVATVSHELRTPLAAVLGFAEVLEGRWGQLTDAQRQLHVQRIVLAANRQKRLVDDVLRVGSLEAERVPMHCQEVSLAEVVAHAVEAVKATYLGQCVDADGPAGATALCDPAHAEQVLVNLLDNAAKYSSEGSPIELRWTEESGMTVLRVRDQGPGIPEASRDVLFTRFGRVPGSRMRAGRVGTGLGLYLGRAYAEAMGGTLELETTSESGCTFCLRLPRFDASATGSRAAE